MVLMTAQWQDKLLVTGKRATPMEYSEQIQSKDKEKCELQRDWNVEDGGRSENVEDLEVWEMGWTEAPAPSAVVKQHT